MSPLAVAAIVTLDAPSDAAEAHFFTFPIAAFDLAIGRHAELQLVGIDAEKNRVTRFLRQLFPRSFQRKRHALGEAVHHAAIPGIGIVFERFLHKAAAQNAALRVWHQQLRMRDLVHAQPAARAAGALRIVEHEIFRLDPAVHKVMRRAAQCLVEAVRFGLPHALYHVRLQQPIAH